MVFQALVLGYAFWVLLCCIRDPLRAFPWLVPLVVVTRSIDIPVIGERIVLFDVLLVGWCALAGFAFLVERRSPRVPREGVFVLGLYGLFLGINALSLIDSVDPVAGIIGLTIYAFGAVICLGTVVSIQETGESRRIVVALLVTFVVVIVLGLAEAAGLSWIIETRSATRLTSTFRNPNQLGCFLFMVLPLAATFGSALPSNRTLARRLLLGSLATCVFVVLLTGSRATLGIVICQILMLLLWPSPYRSLLRIKLLQVGLVALALFPVCLAAGVGSTQFATFQWRVYDWFQYIVTPSARMNLPERVFSGGILLNNYLMPIRTSIAEPWLGVGVGNGVATYEMVPGRYFEVHSQYFATLGETGLLGLLTLSLFLGASGFLLVSVAKTRRSDPWLLLGLGVALISVLISGFYYVILRRREFWIFLGIILACSTNQPGLARFRQRVRLRPFLKEG